MKSAVFYGKHDMRIQESPLPTVGPEEVLIQVMACGVCGTDVHIRAWNDWTQKRMKTPVTIGHEFCGEVVEVGKNVKGIKVGDIVTPESHLPCNICSDCRMGNRHVCQHTGLMGVTRDGGFAEYVAFPAEIAYVAPSGVDYKTLSILEPFGQAVHAVMDYPHHVRHGSQTYGCGQDHRRGAERGAGQAGAG